MPQEGVPVYAFNGTTYTGYNSTTVADGQAVFTLPQGSYRFRADQGGVQYWSGPENHCTIPGCDAVSMTIGRAATPTEAQPPSAPPTEETTPTLDGTPEPSATPEPTEIASAGGSGLRAMIVPALVARPRFQPDAVIVTVEDTNGTLKEGLPVSCPQFLYQFLC